MISSIRPYSFASCCSHVIITLCITRDLFHRLLPVLAARISFNFFLVFKIFSATIWISVACPLAPPEGWWIMISAVRQCKTLALCSAGKQECAHAGCHTDTDGGYITLDVVHCIIDRQACRYRTARAVDIQMDILSPDPLLPGTAAVLQQCLRTVSFTSSPRKMILSFKKSGINIIRTLTAAGLLNDIRY